MQTSDSKTTARRENFVFHNNFFELLFKVKSDDVNEILKAIHAYVNGGDYELSFTNSIIFTSIRQVIDHDNEVYRHVCERNRTNGAKGGRPRRTSAGRGAGEGTCCEEKPKKPKKADMDMGMEMEMGMDMEKGHSHVSGETDGDCICEVPSSADAAPADASAASPFSSDAPSLSAGAVQENIEAVQESVGMPDESTGISQDSAVGISPERTGTSRESTGMSDESTGISQADDAAGGSDIIPLGGGKLDSAAVMTGFNDLFAGVLPRMKVMTPQRRTALRARIRENGTESLLEVLRNVKESPFLQGRNSHGWRADFDWIMRPSNYIKILEGNYNNNPSTYATDRQDYKQSANEYALHRFREARSRRNAQR